MHGGDTLNRTAITSRVRAKCEYLRFALRANYVRIMPFNAIFGECEHVRTRALGSVGRCVAPVWMRAFDIHGICHDGIGDSTTIFNHIPIYMCDNV